MKNLLFIIMALMPASLIGQAVDHFINEDSKWNVVSVYYDEKRTTYYSFLGDTVIGDQTWLKLYSSWDTLFVLNLHYHGLIHSSDGIVLFQDVNNNIRTLYNFNLGVGDSVFFNIPMMPQKIAINKIDSVQINGLYFKRFTFDEPIGINVFDALNEVWIEGIGSHHGLLFPCSPRKFASEWPDKLDLTCSFTEEIQYWDNPSYNGCYINIILDKEELSTNLYKVYPNPFKDYIIIENGNLNVDITTIDIYDIQGNIVYSERTPNTIHRIVLNNLPVGIYYVRLNKDGNITNKKIVKLN